MRLITTRLTLVAAIVVTALVLVAPATGGTTTPAAAKKELRNGCAKLFTQKQFTRYATKVYRRDRISRKADRQVLTMMRCQHSPRAERKMRVVRRQLIVERRDRIAIQRLTPYGPCFGGRWAIPCYIIACESRGSWSAYNPSGAAGPYQIMGMHGRPFPVRGASQRRRHHEIAANLWRGGAGASHWVCA